MKQSDNTDGNRCHMVTDGAHGQPAGRGRAGQGRAGQGRAGQGRAGQGRAGQGRAGQGRAAHLSDAMTSRQVLRSNGDLDRVAPQASEWMMAM